MYRTVKAIHVYIDDGKLEPEVVDEVVQDNTTLIS
jgi:hypothetical protein